MLLEILVCIIWVILIILEAHTCLLVLSNQDSDEESQEPPQNVSATNSATVIDNDDPDRSPEDTDMPDAQLEQQPWEPPSPLPPSTAHQEIVKIHIRHYEPPKCIVDGRLRYELVTIL